MWTPFRGTTRVKVASGHRGAGGATSRSKNATLAPSEAV